MEKTPRANCGHRKWANMERHCVENRYREDPEVVLQSHSRTVKRGLTGALGPDRKGRSLDFCFCERSVTALAWRWWVG